MMFFDIYASTSELGSKKSKLEPILVKESPINVAKKIAKFLEENGYQNIVTKMDYFDIYGEKDGFEHSFVIAINDGASLIQISIYSTKKKGRVKRRLRNIYQEIEELFDR